MDQQILEIRLSHKGIKPVRHGHPWVFRNALASSPAVASLPPEVIRTVLGDGRLQWQHTAPALVCDTTGVPLGWGIYNRTSRLALRMITRNPGEAIHFSLFQSLLRNAVARRVPLRRDTSTTAWRIVFGEADYLPGLVADLLGSVLVIACSSAFIWDNRQWIAATLRELVQPEDVVILPDAEILSREGIVCTDSGSASENDAGAATWQVQEHGLPWLVVPEEGQKTGYYCDQRDNRSFLRSIAAGMKVLDAFTYHGGFGLNALAGGAQQVVCGDSSRDALHRLEENCSIQNAGPVETFRADLFESLRRNDVPHGIEHYDIIVLDPPKLVPARQHHEKGLRAYKDLNLSVFRSARAGARVLTFSCSGAVTREDFRTALAWAASDSHRTVRILATLGQPADHPVPLHFPEAEYLKGYLLQID